MARRKRELNRPNIAEIERLRLNLKLERWELAENAGLERKVFYAWYKEGATATTKNICKIADILLVPPAAITTNRVPMPLPPDSELAKATGYASEFTFTMKIEGVVHTPSQGVDLVVALVQFMQGLQKLGHRETNFEHGINFGGNMFDEIVALYLHSEPGYEHCGYLVFTLKFRDFFEFLLHMDKKMGMQIPLKGIEMLYSGTQEPSQAEKESIKGKYRWFEIGINKLSH